MDDGEIRPQTHTCVPFIIHRSNQSMKLPLLVKHSRSPPSDPAADADPSLLENQRERERERERETALALERGRERERERERKGAPCSR